MADEEENRFSTKIRGTQMRVKNDLPEIQEEGRMVIGDFSLNVYRLHDGRFATGQSQLYELLSGKTVHGGVRNLLNNANLRKYLPESMLKATDVTVEIHNKAVPLFVTEEVLTLFKGIISAAMNGQFKSSWKIGHDKALMLLMRSAENGIEVEFARSIREHPLLTVKQFNELIMSLLHYVPKAATIQ